MLSTNTYAPAMQSLNNLKNARNSMFNAVEQLSSGLRINSAADDAAGSAIANRMTANLRANITVSRGINDGISLMRVAEGGLDVINDLLQRGHQLAVQAATETLSDTDRASLNAEYKLLRAEIDRIALSTEAFGKYPLAPAEGGISKAQLGQTENIKDVFQTSGSQLTNVLSSVKPIGFIPKGATNIVISLDAIGMDDDIQLFSKNGRHLVGTPVVDDGGDFVWKQYGIASAEDLEQQVFKTEYGFAPGTKLDDSALLHPADTSAPFDLAAGVTGTYKGMTFTYSGDGDRFDSDTNVADGTTDFVHAKERLHIDEVTEDVFLLIVGTGSFDITVEWDAMPNASVTLNEKHVAGTGTDIVMSAGSGQKLEKMTVELTPADSVSLGLEGVELDPVEKAREALAKLQQAMNKVDEYRGTYGSMANRFDSAIVNLAQSSMNTATARSRITDTDYAKATAELARTQILQQAGAAVLAQANKNAEGVLTLLRN
ncbi:MAG TPA: flagellin [Candidimonas sp.]|nr:flagellin [Candidimonas sp.]